MRARELYSTETMIQKWQDLLKEISNFPKKNRGLDTDFSKKLLPEELYIKSLGRYATPFIDWLNSETEFKLQLASKGIKKLFRQNSQFCSKSKGSVLQYLQYFDKSEILSLWAKLINE